eukprot:8406698-Heterocapsa_arctica.AAC.1
MVWAWRPVAYDALRSLGGSARPAQRRGNPRLDRAVEHRADASQQRLRADASKQRPPAHRGLGASRPGLSQRRGAQQLESEPAGPGLAGSERY